MILFSLAFCDGFNTGNVGLTLVYTETKFSIQYGQFRALVFGLTDHGIYFIYFYFYYIIFYFKQYVVRGAQFSLAGLNGALMKKKKTATHKTNKDKKIAQTKVREAHTTAQ